MRLRAAVSKDDVVIFAKLRCTHGRAAPARRFAHPANCLFLPQLAPVARYVASRRTPFVLHRAGGKRSRHRGMAGTQDRGEAGAGGNDRIGHGWAVALGIGRLKLRLLGRANG
jgi:hypothetical protein